MKYVELKIHPGQKYRVDDKEFRDLRSLGLVVSVEDEIAESSSKTESAPVTTPKRKTSSKKTSQEESFVTSEDTTEGQTGSDE